MLTPEAVEAEEERRIALATNLIVQGVPRSALLRKVQTEFSIGSTAAGRLVREADHRMQVDAAAARPTNKAAQERRLFLDLARLRSPGEGRVVNYSAVAKLEEQIARLQGNYDPIVIDARVMQEQLVEGEVRTMDDDEARALLDGYEELAAAAAVGRALAGGKIPP